MNIQNFKDILNHLHLKEICKALNFAYSCEECPRCRDPLTLTPLMFVHMYTSWPHTAMVSSRQSLSALSPALRQYFSRKYFIIRIILSCSFLICVCHFQGPPVREFVHQHHHRTLCEAGAFLQRVRDEEHHPALCEHGQPSAPLPRESGEASSGGQGGPAENRGGGQP